MSVKEVEGNLDNILEELATSLNNRSYRPLPVRGVQIPKTNGTMRQLGIPTVIDRIVQQAIAQVLNKILTQHSLTQASALDLNDLHKWLLNRLVDMSRKEEYG